MLKILPPRVHFCRFLTNDEGAAWADPDIVQPRRQPRRQVRAPTTARVKPPALSSPPSRAALTARPTYVTCATDSEKFHVIIGNCEKAILMKNLEEAGVGL